MSNPKLKNNVEQGLEENSEFYQNLYSGKNTLLHLLHMLVSFDQQSKAKPNSTMVQSYLKEVELLQNSSKISLLDYGSGWGTLLCKMPRSFNLYCYDLSENAMKQACRSLGLLGFQVSPAVISNQEIVKPCLVDVITCSHVLEHVEDDRSLLRSFYSALVVNGVLLINVPINEVWDDPKHLRHYTEGDLIQMLAEVGFKVERVKKLDKWTGFILEGEDTGSSITKLRKATFKILRLTLALLPQWLVDWSGERLFADRHYQQVLVLARKAAPEHQQ